MPNWSARVRIVEGPGGYAHRPGELLVRLPAGSYETGITELDPERIGDFIAAIASCLGLSVGDVQESLDRRAVNGYVKLRVDGDVTSTVRRLSGGDITAQPNHVLFADADVSASSVYGSPVYGSPVYGSPVYGSPVYGSTTGPGLTPTTSRLCCRECDPCLCQEPRPVASLVYPNPVFATVVYGRTTGVRYQLTGERRTQARPLQGLAPPSPALPSWTTADVRVAIIDTGYPERKFISADLANQLQASEGQEDDRVDSDNQGDVDPVAGHAMFIAGIIHQRAPKVGLSLSAALSTYGDGDEAEIAEIITRYAEMPEPERPHLVNLSFGGYALDDEAGALRAAVQAAVRAGIVLVAAAGNDRTSRRQYPAGFDGVVSVAALDGTTPAEFSNWGSWVRACAAGVDHASWFWWCDGRQRNRYGADPDRFEDWALWSGTSFAAPVVVAALAQVMVAGLSGREAVERVIDDPGAFRLPCYGTVVTAPIVAPRPAQRPPGADAAIPSLET